MHTPSSIKKLYKLGKQTGIYGITTILPRSISYLLVILHVRVMETSDYGEVTYFYAYAGLANVLYTYGTETAFFRFASSANFQDKKKIYATTFWTLCLSSVLFSSIIFAYVANRTPELSTYALYFVLIIAFDTLSSIPFAKLRLENKAPKFAYIKISNVVLNFLLNAFFLVYCPTSQASWIEYVYQKEIGLAYVFISNLIASLLTCVMLYKEFFEVQIYWDSRLFKKIIYYAYPLTFSGIALFCNQLADRILLEEFLPEGFYDGYTKLDIVGIYSACYKLSLFITLTVTAFKFAAEPFFFSQYKDKQAPETLRMVMRYFIIFVLSITLFINLNLELIGTLILKKSSYLKGIYIVPFVLYANVFLGIYYNLSIWFKFTEKTYYGGLMGGIGAVISISLNILLIPVLGMYGSAIAVLLAHLTMMLVSYYFSRKHYPVPYYLKNAVFYVALSLLLGCISFISSAWFIRNIFFVIWFAMVFLVEYRFYPKPKM